MECSLASMRDSLLRNRTLARTPAPPPAAAAAAPALAPADEGTAPARRVREASAELVASMEKLTAGSGRMEAGGLPLLLVPELLTCLLPAGEAAVELVWPVSSAWRCARNSALLSCLKRKTQQGY
jgi:hypothetical protein